MLTLRRSPSKNSCSDGSTIDIRYKKETALLSLCEVNVQSSAPSSLWFVESTDWGKERFPPKFFALTDNQSIEINDWLKIYGSKITNDGEAVVHLQCPKDVIINRRDRK